MNQRALTIVAVLLFFVGAMLYPLSYVLTQAFLVNGNFSLHYFRLMLSSDIFRDVLFNSMNLAIGVTIASTIIAYPLALLMSRFSLPARGILHALLLLPLVSPPFVGALGIRQIFGRFGAVNIMLLDMGVIPKPFQWLGGGGVAGILALQTIHLVPILYLTISASLRSAHISLEEAARVSGASQLRVLRSIIIPLSFPGWFAGASLVFIASFTDLGTPLIFEYRTVIPVQIYNMLSDLHENPVGYSFVVFTCVVCITLFLLSRSALTEGSYAGSMRAKQARISSSLSPLTRLIALPLLVTYIGLALLPQISVLLIACAKEWFFTTLPTAWTLHNFSTVLTHPMTSHSLLTSLWLSLAASGLTMVLGIFTALVITRGRGITPGLFEILSLLPLAVPGIVFAFGYIGGFAGTPLDNRINPFPLLIAAYAIRRLPAMVRSATAGLQEANIALEEAASVLGATPWTTTRRILLPLISRHIIVGGILTFAYSMIEVSDSLLLALEVKFYPVSKAIYALTARPDGLELASALGSIVMGIMLAAFFGAEWISSRSDRKRTALMALVIALAAALPGNAYADEAPTDELIAVTPHWEGIKVEFERGFAQVYKERTGRDVKIRWLDIGGTSDIVKYIKTQHRATKGHSGIDIMFGGGTDAMQDLTQSGALASTPLSPEVMSTIPERLAGVPLYDRSRTWYTAAISVFGIVVNKVAIDRLKVAPPSTWLDLARPEYFDLVGAADPRKSGSMHAMYEVILQGYGWSEGWKLLAAIAKNVRTIAGSANQVGKDVGTGEVVVGIAIDTYAGDLLRQYGKERIQFIPPTDILPVNGDGVAVITGAPRPEIAKAFIEFILSEKGQKLWYLKLGTPGGPQSFEIGKLPVLPSVYGYGPTATVIEGSPDTWKSVLIYDGEKAANRWNIVNDLFGAFIIDTHERMVSAGRRDPAFTPPSVPLTEAEASALSPLGSWGADGTVRGSKLDEWESIASQQLPPEPTRLGKLKWVPSATLAVFLVLIALRRPNRPSGRN